MALLPASDVPSNTPIKRAIPFAFNFQRGFEIQATKPLCTSPACFMPSTLPNAWPTKPCSGVYRCWPNRNALAGGGKFSTTGVFHDNLEQADPEKKYFVESILSGGYQNQAAEGVESALTCMMARRTAYTGDEVSYEGVATSGEHWEDEINLRQFA